MTGQQIYLCGPVISEEAIVCEPCYNCLSFLQLQSAGPNKSKSSPGKRGIAPGYESVEVDAISRCAFGKPFENHARFLVIIHSFICVSRVFSIQGRSLTRHEDGLEYNNKNELKNKWSKDSDL